MENNKPKSYNTKNIESFHKWLKKTGYILTSLTLFVGAGAVLTARIASNVVPQPGTKAAVNRGPAYESFGLDTDNKVSTFTDREDTLDRTVKFVQLKGGNEAADYCLLVNDRAECQSNESYWGAVSGAKLGLRVTPVYGFNIPSSDAYYRQLAERLIAAGLTDTILRPSSEMNYGTPADSTAFVATWKRMHAIFKSYNDKPANDAQKAYFKFYWNPRLITGTTDFTSAYQRYYPGTDYVDIVGLNFTDAVTESEPKAAGVATNTWADPTGVWNKHFLPSLTWLRNFANGNSDQIATSEWGLASENSPLSGMDNPDFIQLVFDWHNTLPTYGGGSLAFLSYKVGNSSDSRDYETRKGSVYTYPQARAKMLSLFGDMSY